MTDAPHGGILTSDQFFDIVATGLSHPIDLTEVQPIIEPGHETPMQINAGAGTGKTLTLTLKILYALYVEGLEPKSIVATTFTKKAARELQSRIIEYAQGIAACAQDRINPDVARQIRRRDINRIQTGTLDSIVQETLGRYKEPGDPPPLPIEAFVGRGLMLRHGLFKDGRFQSQDLENFLQRMRVITFPPLNLASKVQFCYSLRDFWAYNGVDVQAYLADTTDEGAKIAAAVIADYEQHLEESRLADFTRFSLMALDKLERGALDAFLDKIHLLLVDEYQDTNYLQERIYFHIARAALKKGGSMVVVGDDDQAIYRFRGATVGLFKQFKERFEQAFEAELDGRIVERLPIITNWRSTKQIIDYCQKYVENDASYAAARAEKPPLEAPEDREQGDDIYLLQVPGDVRDVAIQTAETIREVLQGTWLPPFNDERIAVDPDVGGPGDIAVIAQSVRERGGDGSPSYIGYLRTELENRAGVTLFNPRGRPLEDVPELGTLLGLFLEGIDPDETIQAQQRLPREIVRVIQDWRALGRQFLQQGAPPPAGIDPGTPLHEYLASIHTHKGGHQHLDKESVSEIIYRISTWFDFFQQDIEGLAYMELMQRALAQAEALGSWSSRLAYDANGLIAPSVVELYWQFIVPLAGGDLDVEEELLVTLPRDRIPVLTIHQSKGLEYPMVIVDVGTKFKTNHASQRPQRFPTQPDQQNQLQDEFGPYASYLDTTRSGQDQRFDDLIRKFFVAFSRAQQVLLLVAHRQGIARGVPNVALWYDRTETQGPEFAPRVRRI